MFNIVNNATVTRRLIDDIGDSINYIAALCEHAE